LANAQGLRVFRIAFATFRSAKDGDDSFTHLLNLAFRLSPTAV
jgi:hypothetical protein